LHRVFDHLQTFVVSGAKHQEVRRSPAFDIHQLEAPHVREATNVVQLSHIEVAKEVLALLPAQ
jgi:hypothetical protein